MTPKGPAPICKCGCGEPVKGGTNGIWSQWKPGHNRGPGTSPRSLERKRKAAADAAAESVARHPSNTQLQLFP